MKRLEIVDFLKGYSIFTIMIFHYLQHFQLPNPFNKLIFFGGTGVHLFVLLSGFGLYLSFLNKPLSYPVFLKKRIVKVYIPYIIVVLISALISVFIPIYQNSLYALGGHIFLYKMFDENIIGSYGYPLWFISMILQFYLTFNMVVWIKSKLKNGHFLILSLIVSLCWTTVVFVLGKGDERIWNSFFLQYFWEFSLGMVIADKISKNEKLIGRKINNLHLLIIGLLNCLIYGYLALKAGSVGKLYNDVFALSGYSLLAIFFFNLKIKPINQFFLFFGKISFSVYLLHILIITTLSTLFYNLNANYLVIFSIILIIPLSLMYQKIINRFFKICKL